MPTTVRISEKTLQMLNKLREEMQARSHDEVIRTSFQKVYQIG